MFRVGVTRDLRSADGEPGRRARLMFCTNADSLGVAFGGPER